MRRDSPAGLIQLIDQTVTDDRLKFLIRRLRLCPQTRYRAAERTAADSETITPFQNLGGPLVRDPHLFVQMCGQSQRLRSHLHVRRSQRVGCLQRVTPLDMSTAADAVPNLYIEAPHNRLPHDVFLKLRLRAVVNDLPTAVGTLLRQSNRNLFIHSVRNSAKRPQSVIAAALRPGRFGSDFGLPFEKGAACRFNERNASSSSLRSRSISASAFFSRSRWD